MKWYKVEFELGEPTFGIFLGGSDKVTIKTVIKRYVNKIKEDFYYRIRNVKIKEMKSNGKKMD